MKKLILLILIFCSKSIVFSQNIEILGGIITDSIDVKSGIIKNVSNPVDPQDVATKAYLDSLVLALTPVTYSIGDFAQGGVVFWVDETGQHGLVVSKSNVSNSISWYAGSDGTTRATGNGVYAGKANTSNNNCSLSGFTN